MNISTTVDWTKKNSDRIHTRFIINSFFTVKAREKQPQNQQVNEGLRKAQKLQKMALRKDYYKILDVAKTATEPEIRKAYRKLALIWHPDKHEGVDKEAAEAKYVEIAEAYEVLSNPEARTRYDNGEDINVEPNFQGEI
jgi:DnaJ homolog subfamily C member 3